MNIKYDEVRTDSQKITEAMLSSAKMVPSMFKFIHVIKYQLCLYLAFVILSAFMLSKSDRIDIWLGVLAFGFLHWLFLFNFVSGYANLFSMLKENSLQNLKLVKILSKKIKVYGWLWAIGIFISGVLSVFSELNLGALVFGNFIVSILILMVFSIDVSRFQISSLVGSLSAVKSGFTSK